MRDGLVCPEKERMRLLMAHFQTPLHLILKAARRTVCIEACGAGRALLTFGFPSWFG